MRRSLLLILVIIGALSGLLFLVTAFSVPSAEAVSLSALETWQPEPVSLPLAEAGAGSVAARVAAAHDIYVQKMGTSGAAVPGGVYIYQINYGNQGGAQADNVILTDTLPLSTTYAYDSLGISPVVGPGNIVTWTLGVLLTNTNETFYVALNIDPGFPSSQLDINCAGISSTTPGDTDLLNNSVCTGNAPVNFDVVDLQVNKGPMPADPTPSQTVVYDINYSNMGGAASGPAVLTDTLPLSTTLVSWQAMDWPGLWTMVMTTTNEVVFYAPAGLPGQMNGQLRLRLLADPAAAVGTALVNRVEIDAPGDVDLSNNLFEDSTAVVSPPREDVWINKSAHTAVPVPGGWINYFVNYANNGNTAVPVIITDTLPPELSYAGAFWGGGQPQQNDPFPPPAVLGNQLVWNLGVLQPGEAAWFHIDMNITNTASLTVPVTNCIDIANLATDVTPVDNTACVSLWLNPPGPNLKVTKQGQWMGNSQLRYEIAVKNIGTVSSTNVLVTDTLPISTTATGFQEFEPVWGSITPPGFFSSGNIVSWNFPNLAPGDFAYARFDVDLDPGLIGLPFQTFTNTVEITGGADIDLSDNVFVDVATSGLEINWVDIDVDSGHIYGDTTIDPVSITTAYTQTVFPFSGYFDWTFPQPFLPGDVVTVTAGAGIQPVIITIPTPFTATASSTTDQVWGRIDNLNAEPVAVELANSGEIVNTTTDSAGNFLANFTDIPPGGDGEVRYQTVINAAAVTFHKPYRALDFLLGVNYGHDWVEGRYEPGHTVWITVTDSSSVTIKATAVLTTGPVPWWGGDTGFSTDWPGWDFGIRPDIQSGDWVFARLDTGQTAAVQIGAISGAVDSATDSISGAISAPWWMPSLLNIECQAWGSPGGAPSRTGTVLPDGVAAYNCSWDPFTEWDIKPGQEVGVAYFEPDGDIVYNVFVEAAPDLVVGKTSAGQPTAGGGYSYNVTYANNGGAIANNVLITDVLPADMTYITDTTGVPSTVAGNVVSWDMGSLSPGENGFFDVFVDVSAGVAPGTVLTNTAVISSNEVDPNPGDNTVDWTTMTIANDTHVYVTKGSWTPDPAPGYDFVYTVDACNYGATGSAPVTLTDTLPAETTLVAWWANIPGWSELSSGPNQLVVTRPTVDAGTCWTIFVQVTLSPVITPGTPITNTAVITSSNDLDAGDNQTTLVLNAGVPRLNLDVKKQWNGGDLVPGGVINYNISVANSGNIPVAAPVWVTDTLPMGTTFQDAWLQTDTGPVQAVPVISGTGFVVWDVGALDAGAGAALDVQLGINNSTAPGTALTNTAEVVPLTGEVTYDDNVAVWVEQVYPPGPNLRVRKEGGWVDNGPGTRAVWYNVFVENVGDAPVNNVVVTDTYPASMVLLGGVNSDWPFFWSWADLAASNQLTVTFDALYPGEAARFDFTAEVPGSGPLAAGLVFDNYVRVMRPSGDPTPLDNLDSFILGTGPDLAVSKEFVAGIPLPGELITFNVHWSNREGGNEWWWGTMGDVWITDTLPDDLEFVSAIWPSCGNCPIVPDTVQGNQLGFRLVPIGAGAFDEILITALVSDTARSGSILVNQVVITSTNPISDADPFRQDNAAFSEFQVQYPSGVADMSVQKIAAPDPVQVGQMLVYTLTVTNNGPDAATGVILYDALPFSVLPNALFGAQNCNLTNAGDLICNLGGMIAGESITITLWVTPTVVRDIVNYAVVDANEIDINPQNDISGVQTTVTDQAQVFLVAILPDSGTNDQSTSVTVLGANFQNGAVLSLGGTLLQSITFISPKQLQAIVPSGMTSGIYDLEVVNPDGASDMLLNAFVVVEPTPPVLFDSWPPLGPNDVPVTLDIYGVNFAPGISVTLETGGFLGRSFGAAAPTVIPLQGIALLSPYHLRAIVPINTPPGVYTLTVVNPNQTSAQLPMAYESVDAASLDDLYAQTLDFWAQPPTIRAGAAVTPLIGLRVHRASGQTPLANVKVAFWDGDPQAGGAFIGLGSVPLIDPGDKGSTLPVPWQPAAPGVYTLYAVIDSGDSVVETNEMNNVVTRTVTVLPSLPDTTPPSVISFTVNGGAQTTNDRQVALNISAVDSALRSLQPASDVIGVIYVEFEFVQSIKDWVPVQVSDWLPYAQASVDYLWQLRPSPGAHYIKAWVADGAGNVSPTPGSQLINYMPDQAEIVEGQVYIYRVRLNAGDGLRVRLTSLAGDADLYVWNPDSTSAGSSYNDSLASTVDEVSFTAAMDGVYQIEVEGFATLSLYTLEVIPTVSTTTPLLIARPSGRARGQPMLVPGEDPTDDVGLPSAEPGAYTVYLPVVLRQ